MHAETCAAPGLFLALAVATCEIRWPPAIPPASISSPQTKRVSSLISMVPFESLSIRRKRRSNSLLEITASVRAAWTDHSHPVQCTFRNQMQLQVVWTLGHEQLYSPPPFLIALWNSSKES